MMRFGLFRSTMILSRTSRRKDQLSQHPSKKTSRSSASRQSKKSQLYRRRHDGQKNRKPIFLLRSTQRSTFQPAFKIRPCVKPPEPRVARRVSPETINRRGKRKGKQPKNGNGGTRR